MQSQYRFLSEFSAAALIGFRGIGEAIAEYYLPPLQRRPNHLRDVLRTGRKHQSHLCQRIKIFC